MDDTMNDVSIVVAECGGDWTGWVQDMHRGTSTLVVLVQDTGEAPAHFSARVIAKLAKLRRTGAEIRRAAYVAGTCTDGTTLHQRSKVMRKLSAQIALNGGEGELHLDPATPEHRPAPTWTRALAMTLRDMARGSGLLISVGPSPA